MIKLEIVKPPATIISGHRRITLLANESICNLTIGNNQVSGVVEEGEKSVTMTLDKEKLEVLIKTLSLAAKELKL